MAACLAGGAAFAGSAAPTYNRSWIHIDASAGAKVLTEGQTWVVPVEYYLDGSEDDGGTTLYVFAPGPWIDCPDGKYTQRRHHEAYPRMRATLRAKPGRHKAVIKFTVPPPLPRNMLQLVARFQDKTGKRWPWDVRRGKMWFRRACGFFELETDKPGNLFTYAEPVRIVARLRNVKPGGPRALRYIVRDYHRSIVAKGKVAFAPTRDGQRVPIDLALDRRGTFLIEVDVPGWEKRHTTFCRIPDVLAITKSMPTRFGMSNVVSPRPDDRVDAMCRIARRMGLTTCRSFMSWNQVEPARGEYKLDDWDRAVEVARRNGVQTWFCIVAPPPWAQKDAATGVHYRAFRGDRDAWRDFVRHTTTRFKGRFYGWEWLNEIVPGGSQTPVEDYVKLVRIGTATAKAADPNVRTLLAGGLWPRSFRVAVLKAGAGKYIDALPLHYANGPAVREALSDLAAVGAEHVEVWDDETARGISTWGAPPLDDLSHTLQSNWILTQWPDELAAGCGRITYFGGLGDAAGNWSYLHDDLSPRPVAATIAVFVSKVHDAKPLGTLSLGRGGLLHVFEREGKAVVIASSYIEGEAIVLPVGAESVTLTDYQGNERQQACPGGIAKLRLSRLRYYVAGADVDVLKAQLVGGISTCEVAPTYSGHFKDLVVLAGTPRVAMLAGKTGRFTVHVRNLYDRELKGRFRVELPAGWHADSQTAFTLKAGEQKLIPVALHVPDGAPADQAIRVVFTLGRKKLPIVAKPMIVSVLSRDAIGNLLANGDFETLAKGGKPGGWTGMGKLASAKGLGDGLGRRVLRFDDTKNQWAHQGQTVELRGGRTYLYTAWVWNRDMHAGSNITQSLSDGTTRRLYDVHVFVCGQDNPHWQLYAARFQAPPKMVRAHFQPVVRGKGWAAFDNIRVSVYEGSDYAAEAWRAAKPPVIDGKFDEWANRCPIPLIGKNQLTTTDTSYAWSAENLSAVAWLQWDAKNLYLAVSVRDDRHLAVTGEKTARGDSVTLAIHPAGRAAGEDAKAFEYHISSATPGGGSGKHTLYRPKAHSAGLASGQLAKDSSVYALAVKRTPGRTTYELRLPLAELGGLRPTFGGKFGMSLQLNDNDGAGRAAVMNWGEGLQPAWRPSHFGVVTFVEPATKGD